MNYEKVDAIEIGKKIKGLREGRKETMADLAKAVDTSESAIGMYECGKRIPRDEIKLRLAEHFVVPIEDIFFPKRQHESCDLSA